MREPDEFFIPDAGDPWQQQMMELEELEESEKKSVPEDSIKKTDTFRTEP